MAYDRPVIEAGETPVRDHPHFFQAGRREGIGCKHYLEHAGRAYGALIADNNDVAGTDFARYDGGKCILILVENLGRGL